MSPFNAINRKRSFAFLLCDGVRLSDDNPNEVPISLFANARDEAEEAKNWS